MMATSVAIIIGLALAFDYLNGFHDAANSIATVVSTRVLSPRTAVIWAAVFNFIAFVVFPTHVSSAIAKGVALESVTHNVIAATLGGAIVWNLLTWWWGLPSSSSHALMGGFAGAALSNTPNLAILDPMVFGKTLLFIVLAPTLGMCIGYSLYALVRSLFRNARPGRMDRVFRRGQLVSAALYSLGHGGNDAQKTMGIITLLLVTSGMQEPSEHPEPRLWVVLLCHAAMGLGTLSGGWRVCTLTKAKILGHRNNLKCWSKIRHASVAYVACMTSRRRRGSAMVILASSWLVGSACSKDESVPAESTDESLDGGGTGIRGDTAVDDPATADAGTHVFDTLRVATIDLEVSDDALAILRADAERPFNTEDFTYVPARMTFDGEVYEEVGLRVKGNSSRAMAQGDALPFKVDMNRYLSGQRLDGLTKINLHNNVNQPAAMNEYLSYGAFREFGVAASRTGWVDLTLNGQSLGLYTLVEQVNDKMLERWYDDGDAALYKPESPAGSLRYLGDTIDDYTNVGYKADNDTDHATFLRMVKSINEADASTWDDVIDIESVLSYFAGSVALGNWDTYVAMSHNYYLFEATPGKMVMLPWDMNLSQGAATSVCPTELRTAIGPGRAGGSFGGMGFDPANPPTSPEGSVLPGGFMIPGDGGVPMMGGRGGVPGGVAGGFAGGGGAPLHDGLMGDAGYFARYIEVLRSFLSGPGSVAVLNARIDAAADVLGERISSEGVSALRDTIASRVSALEGALAKTTSCPLAGESAAPR